MAEVLQEQAQETDGEQYVIVYPDRVICCPQDVRTFVQVCEFQNSHMREAEPELFSLGLKAFRGIQDTIRSLQHCTSSFRPESVWLGFGGWMSGFRSQDFLTLRKGMLLIARSRRLSTGD